MYVNIPQKEEVSLPVMIKSNLGYKNCFPLLVSFQRTSSLVESSSFKIAATRLSYITAASKSMPKSSSGVLKRIKKAFVSEMSHLSQKAWRFPCQSLLETPLHYRQVPHGKTRIN